VRRPPPPNDGERRCVRCPEDAVARHESSGSSAAGRMRQRMAPIFPSPRLTIVQIALPFCALRSLFVLTKSKGAVHDVTGIRRRGVSGFWSNGAAAHFFLPWHRCRRRARKAVRAGNEVFALPAHTPPASLVWFVPT
jgi:hypothetical protein